MADCGWFSYFRLPVFHTDACSFRQFLFLLVKSVIKSTLFNATELQSMTVGGDDCEDETEVNDLRESVRAWSSLASPSSSIVDQPVVCLPTVDFLLMIAEVAKK